MRPTDRVTKDVLKELERAQSDWPKFISAHEGR